MLKIPANKSKPPTGTGLTQTGTYSGFDVSGAILVHEKVHFMHYLVVRAERAERSEAREASFLW